MKSITQPSGCGTDVSQSHPPAVPGAPSGAMDFGDLLVWPRGEAGEGRYVYLPLAPTLSDRPDSLPHVGLMDAGSASFFYATLQLSAPVERLELLRRDLASEAHPVPHLSPAALRVTAAELVLLDDEGGETVLHSAVPAPHPPYTALLQTRLPDEAKPAMQAALLGHSQKILLRYDAELEEHTELSVVLHGTFPDPLTQDALAGALASGTVAMHPCLPEGEIRTEVLSQAARLSGMAAGRCDENVIHVRLSVPRVEPRDISVDLGHVMAAHAPLNDPLPPD